MADADYAIISRDTVRRKGAAAFAHGRARDSHGFNPGSLAIHEFLIGYDMAAATANSTPANCGRVELAQES